ncbi:MAG: DUF1573 domain-containing protein, partial [Verrucomicrobiales bacterium]|nr:DUF1573 domain-containing protein [Verrucomicrobiales bacterium]
MLRYLIPLVLLTVSARADWQWANDLAGAPLREGWHTAAFKFTNSGTVSVSASRLSFSCSCTEFQFTSGAAKPNTGATLTVKVRSDSKHSAGKELDFYAIGPDSTTPKKLTLKLEP